MRIVFTGGGTGGHFYPLIAVAEALRDIVLREKVVQASFWYFSDTKVDPGLLAENEMEFVQIPAGKLRMSPSIKNITDMVKTLRGFFVALRQLYKIYPDVVFAKGGYASFPTLLAARVLRIPVMIHESDVIPGRVTMWAGKFATRIATSFPEASLMFKKEKTACLGLPMRKSILLEAGPLPAVVPVDSTKPIILVVGGSQGSETINTAVMEALTDLLASYTVVHQTGEKNLDLIVQQLPVLVPDQALRTRYVPLPYIAGPNLKAIGSRSKVVISRAGSMIFEIASWGVPSILIPISHSHGDHQRKNAFAAARAGASEVIEEANLTPHILASEVRRITGDEALMTKMKTASFAFARTDAALLIADEIFKLALAHTE